LVAIEPASMTAVFCHNAADRSATSWHEQVAPFTALEFAVSDAAKGIKAGLDRLAQQRHAAGDATPLAQGLDLFHTAREARTVLTRAWHRAERAWTKAEALDTEVARLRRQGQNAQGRSQTATVAWRHAVAAFDEVESQEAAWRRARGAFDRFDPDGRLNTRTRAESEITAVVTDLSGEAWTTVRGFLRDRRSTAFLDRMHERLSQAEPRAEWREAMAWRWWGRHEHPSPSADAGVEWIRSVAWGCRLNEAEAASSARVSAVLASTVRASSAVECLNSVLRMQQSRHKRMTQAMLDLKRLYWNCHGLKSGKRKGGCPYKHLGLSLSSYDFWTVLQTDPERLTQELSSQQDAP
jgi:hypothetical protein